VALAARVPPGVEHVLDDLVHACAPGHLREDEGPVAAHPPGVAVHDGEVGADREREVGLVDDEEVGLRDAGPALARDLVAAGDVDDVDGVIGQLPAEVRGQVVAARLDEEEIGAVQPELLIVESGGDNLAAQFSRELVDYTIYVIDVSGGDKIPRKGGPGITQSDLLVINKTDLAPLVGGDLSVMARDAAAVRGGRPVLFTSLVNDPLAAEVAAWVRSAPGIRPA